MATPVVAGGLEATGPPSPTLGPTTEPYYRRQVCRLQVVPSQVDVLGHGAAFITEKIKPGPADADHTSRFPADDDRVKQDTAHTYGPQKRRMARRLTTAYGPSPFVQGYTVRTPVTAEGILI